MKPAPEPVDPQKLPELAQSVIRRAPFPVLATVDSDGAPRARPVSPVLVEGFTIWVASLRSSHKTSELDHDSRVELCYMDEGHDQVRITGRAILVENLQTKQRLWDQNPLLRSFLGQVDNPEFMLYRVDPIRVRFMREWALEYHEVPIN